MKNLRDYNVVSILTTPNSFLNRNGSYVSKSAFNLAEGFIKFQRRQDGYLLMLDDSNKSFLLRDSEFPGLIEALCDSY